MKADKSKSQFLKLTATSDVLKKELSIQREANKKYEKFKKSASQPVYFLNKSRLKKISDIYRAMSLQKLSKNSLNKSKSLYTSVTPEKKPSVYTNSFFTKKQTCVNTLNLNKMLDTNEKTKRLRLNRTIQNPTNTASEIIAQNAAKFLTAQVQKLQEITNLTLEKTFLGQYDHFFRGLKEECFKKGCNVEVKVLVSKFCYLMEVCEQKIIRHKEKQIRNKYDKIEMDFSNTNTELKKKTLKMQLLIKEMDQLKAHNIKISNELNELRGQNKKTGFSQKTGFVPIQKSPQSNISHKNKQRRLQITHMLQIKLDQAQAEISTPIYHHKFQNHSEQEESSSREILYFNKGNDFFDHQQNNDNEKSKKQKIVPMQINEKVQMIKRIRAMEKKQKDLVKTLMVLKNDGIDVQKAFHEVVSGQVQDLSLAQQQFKLPKHRTPTHIKQMTLNDPHQADDSIIQSIDGLTVRYFDGQPDEQYITYPIRHQYKSKPLDEALQNRLKLNFDILYEDYQCFGESQDSEQEEDDGIHAQQQPPTI